MGSFLPWTTWAMLAVMASNSAANREPGLRWSGVRRPLGDSEGTVTRRADVDVAGACRRSRRLAVAITVAQVAPYLAIDVGTDRLAAGVVDGAGEVVVRDRVATPPRDVWPALHRLVRRVVAARPDDAGPLGACGVSCEGPIDAGKGTVSPLHMPVWQSFELRERVARADRAADRPRPDGPGPRARRALERRRPRRRRRDGAAAVGRRRGRGGQQRAAAPGPPRQRRPARPRRRRARRPAVRRAAGPAA